MLSQLTELIKDFGSLVNLAILLSILGYITRIHKAIIRQYGARIDLLKEQVRIKDAFSVEKVTEKFRELKEYYENQVTEWYEKSIEALGHQHEAAIKAKEDEFAKKLEDEMDRRLELRKKYQALIEEGSTPSRKRIAADLVGTYSVLGNNPGASVPGRHYFGTLKISRLPEVFSLDWRIESVSPPQKFQGKGVLMKDVLSVVFTEPSPRGLDPWWGVVSYEVVNEDVLRGIWTGIRGPATGWEELRKLR